MGYLQIAPVGIRVLPGASGNDVIDFDFGLVHPFGTNPTGVVAFVVGGVRF